jgi:hypothetical protein
MSTAAITWNRAGSSGTYAIFSSSAGSGYAYFVGQSTTTGVPLNKLVSVNHSFTSINVVGIPNDIINLYKIAVDANTSTYADPSAAYYQWFDNSLLTSKTEFFASSGSYSLPNFAMPIADIELHGGGAGGHTHNAGGGAGGSIYLSLFPIAPNTSYTVGAGSGPNSAANGGDTTFGSLNARGGGAANNNSAGSAGGCGGGGGQNNSGVRAGGSSNQASFTGGRINTILGTSGGHSGGGANHTSGGGGGATGAGGNGSGTTPGAGGPGYTSPINGVIYSVGGFGSYHEGGTHGGAPAGYGNPGSGGGSAPNGTSAAGQPGIILIRSYG